MEITLTLIITILFSALFSGMEIAYITADKFRIAIRSQKGILTAKVLNHLFKKPAHFIGTMLVGNNTALVVYGIIMSQLLRPVVYDMFPVILQIEFLIMITETIIATLIILIIGEFLPKVIFRINPNLLLNFFSIPMLIIYYILYPFVYFIMIVSKLILNKILRLNFSDKEPVFGIVEASDYLEKHATRVETDKGRVQQEIILFKNALDFSTVKVRECMVPRTEIVGIKVNASAKTLKTLFNQSGYSKILIYKESTDDIIGYVHVFDLIKEEKSIESMMLSIDIVPETMSATDVLKLFIENHRSIALVVDEFGGTSGIVTLEDVMEEIVGEIADEHDSPELIELMLNEKEFIFSTRHEIDYLNEKYKLNLPENEDYETLNGYILSKLEYFPRQNDTVSLGQHTFIILNVSDKRIDKVKLKITE